MERIKAELKQADDLLKKRKEQAMQEKKLLCFISGKITGTRDYLKRFSDASDFLELMGNLVVNPADICKDMRLKNHAEYMRITLKLLGACDCIYLLDDYFTSIGAVQEEEFAIKNQIEIWHLMKNIKGNYIIFPYCNQKII